MINGSTSNALPLAGVAPAAPAKAQPIGRGDGAFSEALAGAHTVQDRRDAQASASRDAANRTKSTDDRSQRTERSARPDRPERTERPERAEGRDNADATSKATGTDATQEHTTTSEATTHDAAPVAEGETGEAVVVPVETEATVTVAVDLNATVVAAAAAAGTTVQTADAVLAPTVPTVQVATDAVDAAVRLAITSTDTTVTTATDDAAVAAPVDVDGEAKPVTAAVTTTVDTEVDAATASLAKTAVQGTEDAGTDAVEAGQTSQLRASASPTSGPTPAQQATPVASTQAAPVQVEGEQPVTQAAVQQVAAAPTTQVADGEQVQSAQLTQAVASTQLDSDVEVKVDADVDVDASQVKTAVKADAGLATDVDLNAEVIEAEPAIANLRTAPLGANLTPASQAQAATLAKAAEAAAEEGSDTAAPRPAEPLTSATLLTGTTRNDQAAVALRASVGQSEGLQDRIDHIAEQLATRLRLSHAAGGSEVNMSLRPRELGDVTVQMRVRDGIVAATVLVDRAETLGALQTNIEELKKSLEQQGLVVQEFNVDVRGEGQASTSSNGNDRQSAGSNTAASLAGAAAATPGLTGDRDVAPEEVHEGEVSVLA